MLEYFYEHIQNSNEQHADNLFQILHYQCYHANAVLGVTGKHLVGFLLVMATHSVLSCSLGPTYANAVLGVNGKGRTPARHACSIGPNHVTLIIKSHI
jgi:hypothetical protein